MRRFVGKLSVHMLIGKRDPEVLQNLFEGSDQVEPAAPSVRLITTEVPPARFSTWAVRTQASA